MERGALWEFEVFCAVAERQSFVLAARALGVSPSAVTRAVQSLERQVGVQLLLRSHSSVVLTPQGESYYESARELLRLEARAREALHDVQDGARGRLCFSAPDLLGVTLLPAVLRRYTDQHPGVSIDVTYTDEWVDPIAEGLDFAVRGGFPASSDLLGARLWPYERLLCASPDYLARRGAPRDLSEIPSHDGLIGSSEHWRFTEAGREVSLRPTGRWRCNSGAAVLDAALQGLGLCQLPDFYVAEALASGALLSLLDEARPPDEGVWAVHPHPRHVPPKVRAMIDWLHDRLSHAPRSPA